MKLSAHKLALAALGTGAFIFGGAAEAALIGHYTFDADASDSAGSRNGTLVGSAAIDVGVSAPAPGGSAGSLNLTNGGHVALPSATTDTYDEYSIAMWVKVNGDNGGISGLYTSDAWDAGALHVNHESSGTPRLEASIGGYGLVTHDVEAAPVDWVHMLITHQTVGEGTKLWINGVEVDEIATGGPTRLLDTSQVGNWAGADRQFDGWIDDLRIYDEILTESQVQALVPEPGSLALLGLGGLLIARRRRA